MSELGEAVALTRLADEMEWSEDLLEKADLAIGPIVRNIPSEVRLAHTVDIIVRKDGQERRYQGDWMKGVLSACEEYFRERTRPRFKVGA